MELLIVIVVIAILATIIIVGYNGISRQAKETAVQAEVKQGATALVAYRVMHGSYPADCEDAGVKVSSDHTLECSADSGGAGFCLSISRDDISYRADNNSLTPSVGGCTLPTYIPDTQMAKLTASDRATGDRFGESVSISGNMAIIGAYNDDDNGSNSGSACVFQDAD